MNNRSGRRHGALTAVDSLFRSWLSYPLGSKKLFSGFLRRRPSDSIHKSAVKRFRRRAARVQENVMQEFCISLSGLDAWNKLMSEYPFLLDQEYIKRIVELGREQGIFSAFLGRIEP